MKNIHFNIKPFSILVLSIFLVAGCELTEVSNPLTTAEDLENNSSGSTPIFINGLKQTTSTIMAQYTVFNEAVTDNYDNIGGERRPHWDKPREISPLPGLLDVGPYDDIHLLKSGATFVIETVFPNDDLATMDMLAESYLYRGLAYLLLGESYVGAPIEEDGELLSSEEILNLAIADLKESLNITMDAEFSVAVKILLARIYRILGDKGNAVAYAEDAIASGSDDYVYTTPYDAINLLNSWSILTSWQPLPRLDFLDKKYHDLESSIMIAKMEEAYLIRAEAEISDGNYEGAKNTLAGVIDIVNTRPTTTYFDESTRPDDLVRNPGGTRPMSGKVKFDADSEEIDNLIIPRNGSMVTLSSISGTHLTSTEIMNIDVSNNDGLKELFYSLYLMRQEIFFAEGRRLADLGIKLPVSQRQVETEAKLTQGDPLSLVSVPAYIPQGEDMDLFTVDGDVTTMLVDMNKVIVENRNEVSPFTLSF